MERTFEQNYKRLGMLEIDGQEGIDTQHFKPYITDAVVRAQKYASPCWLPWMT